MKKNLTLLIVSAVLSFSACEKIENVKEGVAGAKGDNGSTIHSGTGAPMASLGANGDFYLDKTTAELYGPKAASGWPTPISLKGTAGAVGAAGTQILSGAGAPANTLGAVNDFYFDTTNMAFYGPKAASTWGSALALGATNAVTTFLYQQQTFATVNLAYTDSYGEHTFYKYKATKQISISHQAYTDAYNRGIILVRYKMSGDNKSNWSKEVYVEEGDYSARTANDIYIEDDDERLIFETGITVNGEQGTFTDPTGNQLKTIKFDVKVVCIPSGAVLQMKAKAIDITDATAVAKYLNL